MKNEECLRGAGLCVLGHADDADLTDDRRFFYWATRSIVKIRKKKSVKICQICIICVP